MLICCCLLIYFDIIVCEIRSGAGTDTEFLYDVASIKDGDHLIAIMELGGDEQEGSVDYVSDTEAWLLTGHHTRDFKVLEIKKNDASPDKEWVSLKHSSFFMREHKFAIVGKEPGAQNDRRRWCARLYQLEQTENATLKIKSNQDGTSGLNVSVVYGDNGHEVPLSPSGEPKVFDQDDQASRGRKIDRAIAVGQLLVGVIAIPITVLALPCVTGL